MALLSGQMWSVYKELYGVIDLAIKNGDDYTVGILKNSLKTYLPEFFNILQNPAKSVADHNKVLHANTQGIQLSNQLNPQTLTTDFISEAITLSELFNLNEIAAVDLLLSAENQLTYFPDLPRGLVAVLLYYDGKASLVNCLKLLLQVRDGRTWLVPDMAMGLREVISKFTGQVIQQGLVAKVLDMLRVYNDNTQLDRLQQPEFMAVGPPKHKQQVVDKIKEINSSLCSCLFYLSCQSGLSREDALVLIGRLSTDSQEDYNSTLSDKTLALFMTFLYAVDVKILEREDSEALIEQHPMLADKSFIPDVNREIMSNVPWSIPGLKTLVQFAWAVTLNQLSTYIELDEYNDCMEELMNTALEQDVFFLMKNVVVANDSFFGEEYYVRRLHALVTDFICNVPLKVKELRMSGDEAARIIMARQQDDLDIPATISKHFQHFLELISDLYSKDPLGLELSSDFWISDDQSLSTSFSAAQPAQQQVSLFKFIRLAGDMLLPPLYVPYINMLAGLSNNRNSAQHCFNLLKVNSSGTHASIVSWDHFFMSLNQYHNSLCQETFSSQESQQTPAFGYHRNNITPQEVEGLRAVLRLIRVVIDKSEEARVALSESGRCHPLPIIFGLVTCAIPPNLKADLLDTLAAFAKTPEVTANMWHLIENSQLLCSVSSSNMLLPGGIQSELEEVESRNEEYPMTRAFVRLVGTLVLTPIPPALGAGIRPTGFYPYLDFLRDSVFLKFNSRSYKRPSEKWEVCAGVLEVLHRLVESYDINVENFDGSANNYGRDPGHVLLLQMYSESNLLKMILFIIDEAMKIQERYVPVAGREYLNKSSLYALKLLQVALSKQDQFLEALRHSGSPVIGIGLDKLLLGINPRSGRSDHVVNVAKFVINNGSLLQHALSAVNIFLHISRSAYAQSKIVGLLISSEEFVKEMMCGFAECLEFEETENEAEEYDPNKVMTTREMRVHLRQMVMSLLLASLDHPAPNLTHLLCGFDIKRTIQKTSLQDPGVDGFPRTCLHSVMMMMSRGTDGPGIPMSVEHMTNFSELAYRFIHSLCTNVQTYVPFLRYLRSHDFLYKQVAQLPFATKSKDGSAYLLHTSWLLKSIIIDLRVSSINQQRSYVQRIMELLISEKNYKGSKSQNKLLSLLNSIDFSLNPPPQLELASFNRNLIEQLIASCEVVKDNKGFTWCDIKTLFRVLVSECNTLTGPLAPQRERAIQEIDKICRNVMNRNKFRKELHARKQALIAWRQSVEVLLTACPADLLVGERRQLFIVDVLQLLLHKLTPDSCSDLASQGACVILVLVCNLSSTFKTSEGEGIMPHPSCDFVSPDISMVVAKQAGSTARSTFSTSLQVVLSGLLQYLLTTASLGQKVRIYIYGAVLYYFEIAEKPVPLDIFVNGPLDRSLEKQLSKKDNEYDKLSRENMATVNKFAGPLLVCLCKDACDGHDVAKMLVMSVLNKILSKDHQKSWISEMSSRGYIQHMINSLVDDDNQLMDLSPRPEPLRALYIFQSKISLLTRISMIPLGAQALLDLDLMSHLSECKVFDLRPEQDHSSPEGFIPAVLTRYRQQILFPVLHLCLSFLTTLGSSNIMAANKVLSFIMSHIEVFLNILSDKQPQHHTIESLRELQLTAALVAWTAQDVFLEDMILLDSIYGELKMCLNRLQRQMMLLLVRFSLSDVRRKNFVDRVVENTRTHLPKEVAGNDLRSKVTIIMEEIVSSSLTLATSLVTKSVSNKAVPVLFGANLSRGTDQYRNSPFSRVHDVNLTSTTSQMPCLGVIVQLLDDASQHFLSTLESHKTLLGKYNSISDLTPTEIIEICGREELSDKLSLQERNKFVAGVLIDLLKYRSKEIRLLSYIIENALLLLWRHLEFYLVVCQSRRPSFKNSGLDVKLEMEMSRDQLNQLKQECLTWIDDALLKRLQDIELSYGQDRSKFGFTSVLVRRIKRMLTFRTMLK